GFPWWVPGLTMFAMYALGLVIAPVVAFFLKRTLLRGEAPPFVMEMPLYKWPSLRTVVRRITDSGWAFLRRAGTLILAAMVLVWALLYFPRTDAEGTRYDEQIAQLEHRVEELKTETAQAQGAQKADLERALEELQLRVDHLYGDWRRQSWLG